LVASAQPDREHWLPAAARGVWHVTRDDTLALGEVRVRGSRRLAAPGRPRDLMGVTRTENFAGASFACARGLVHLARAAHAVSRCA
jgi:hypothetical protein